MAEEKGAKEPKEGKKAERKGKKPRSKHKHASVQVWKKYAGGKAAGKWCPRCGSGTFLAVHKNRVHCGKCGYAEIKK